MPVHPMTDPPSTPAPRPGDRPYRTPPPKPPPPKPPDPPKDDLDDVAAQVRAAMARYDIPRIVRPGRPPNPPDTAGPGPRYSGPTKLDPALVPAVFKPD